MKDQFKHGEFYTRIEISSKIGGDYISFLPSKNKSIVCGCFSPSKNPEAPRVVLAGKNPNVRRNADIFSKSHNYIPIFIKKSSNKWQYVGQWKFKREITDPAAISKFCILGNRSINSIYKAIELME